MAQWRLWTGVAMFAGSAVAAGCDARRDGVCADYCAATVACSGASCEISAGVDACRKACEAGMEAVNEVERALLHDCMVCGLELAEESCTVAAEDFAERCGRCLTADFIEASEKFGEVASADFTCDNGRPVLSVSSCSYETRLDGGCVHGCCASHDCPLNDVQVTCNAKKNGKLSCSCTAGKNVGKKVKGTCDAPEGPDEIWNQCNL